MKEIPFVGTLTVKANGSQFVAQGKADLDGATIGAIGASRPEAIRAFYDQWNAYCSGVNTDGTSN